MEEIIKRFRIFVEENYNSIKEAAVDFGIEYNRFSAVLNGKRPFNTEFILQLSQKGMSIDYLITGEGNKVKSNAKKKSKKTSDFNYIKPYNREELYKIFNMLKQIEVLPNQITNKVKSQEIQIKRAFATIKHDKFAEYGITSDKLLVLDFRFNLNERIKSLIEWNDIVNTGKSVENKDNVLLKSKEFFFVSAEENNFFLEKISFEFNSYHSKEVFVRILGQETINDVLSNLKIYFSDKNYIGLIIHSFDFKKRYKLKSELNDSIKGFPQIAKRLKSIKKR